MTNAPRRRAFAAVSAVLLFAAGVVACTTGTDEEATGSTEEAICVDFPCVPPRTGVARPPKSVVVSDPPTQSFQCTGPVPGDPNGYFYIITEDGHCAIAKPDPRACPEASASGTGIICWGYSVVSYYICPVNKPNISCVPLTGTCTCY
jgi:hypothetical protein